MAGSLLISPQSAWSQQLIEAVVPMAQLSDADAMALEAASRDVCERVPQLDANCLALAQRLREHPSVEQLMHPSSCDNFKALMRSNAGHGCLLSIALKGGEAKARKVYDALRVSKGPSLGTAFTLACPYTQLAHYDELTWAEAQGVPAHLLRISVGLEAPEDLWQRFQDALNGAMEG